MAYTLAVMKQNVLAIFNGAQNIISLLKATDELLKSVHFLLNQIFLVINVEFAQPIFFRAIYVKFNTNFPTV
jgi:hypothetical protein